MIARKLVNLLSNRVIFLLMLLLIVIIVMSLISPYFFNWDSLMTMTRLGAALALIGLGESLIILSGGAGIDLSIGSIMSISGVLLGFMVRGGINDWIAAVFTVLIGGLLGSINGVTVALWGIPPLIGTLGSMYTYGALALVMTKGIPVSGFSEDFYFLANGKILGIPTQIAIIVLPVFLILLFVTTKTSFGRGIYLAGVNEEAAQYAGIQVKKTRYILYTLNGILAGLAAIIMSSWFMASRPDVGSGMEMRAITVAVLGGIHIFGGVGNLFGTLLAVILVTMIASGLQLANINTIWQLGVLGFILLMSVALNELFMKSQNKS